MTKRAILEQIKRLAEANGGKPLGEDAFRRESGIQKSAWWPHMWVKWGDALEAAGLPRNTFTVAIDERVLLEKYALLTRELGHLPILGELRRQKRVDPTFPNDNVLFRRYGGKASLVSALLSFCESTPGFEDIAALCHNYAKEKDEAPTQKSTKKSAAPTGYVYLIKSGRHHKIGRTNSIGRREWELGIKIPVPPKTIHVIKTDDPVGVEKYWHTRFSEKRGEGEWFELTLEDIAAFKRWKQIA